MRRIPIVDDDPVIGIANACRKPSPLEGMLLLWPPLPARCPIRKAGGRGETLQSPETTSIVDGKGCRPRPGRNKTGTPSKLLHSARVGVSIEAIGEIACGKFQGDAELSKPDVPPRGGKHATYSRC